MNPLTFTTTYKGNELFDLKIKVGDTEIPCSVKKWAWPWKYGTKLELRLYFKDLKKKATTHITGGIQHELFQFFRYDIDKMRRKKKGGGKKTFKSEQRKENKGYYQSVKKCRKMKDKNKQIKCYKECNRIRVKTLKSLEKEYPDEWLEFKNKYGGMGQGSFHMATGLEGSWLYKRNDWKNHRSARRNKLTERKVRKVQRGSGKKREEKL
jgi:hypothetical protein